MPLVVGTIMPSLDGTTEWLNQNVPLNTAAGHPILLQFWAISCPICKANTPRLQNLLETYTVQGLQLISVHMPRMEADMDVGKVGVAVKEIGLTGPCAIDNAHALGDRFQTGGVWPCYFLFDAEGRLRSRAAGIRGLKMAENSLKRMLGDSAQTGAAA